MLRSRVIASAVIVAALLVVTPATGAAAMVTAAAVPSEEFPFVPSPSKWREWMLNVTGKVLGAAMPDKWRAEQIANGYKYNYSWEKMRLDFGFDPNKADYVINPDSYDDYVLRKTEMDLKGGTAGKPMAPPATKGAKFTKTVGGVLGVYGAVEMGAFLGSSAANAGFGLFGIDANGLVCAHQESEFGTAAVRFLSGQDCSMWDMAVGYVPNSDATAGWSVSTWNGGSVHLVGRGLDGSGNRRVCVNYTAPASFSDSGGTVNLSGMNAAGGWIIALSVPLVTPTTGTNPCVGKSSHYYSATAGFYADGAAVYFRYSSGAVAGPPPTMGTADPDRQLKCDVEYTDGSSSSKLGAVFKESAGTLGAAECPSTPPGKTPESVAITDNATHAPVFDEDITPEYSDWWTDYPECRTGACKLDLKKTAGTVETSCFDLELGCVDWFTDPDKASVYTCTYGAHEVELAECNVYSGLFQPGRLASGAAYSDPLTGEWSGGTTSPTKDSAAMGQPIQDPSAAYRNCNGIATLGFDPVGWVMVPVGCALERAFVPRPLVVQTSFSGVEEAWAGRPPAVIADFANTATLSPAASGCSQSVTVLGVSFPIIDTCPGSPMASVAAISRLVTSAGMVLMVLVVLRRQIAGMVGYNQGQG